jgi:plastocyanin
MFLISACDDVRPSAESGPRVIELAHDTIRLEPGSMLVEVRVRRSGTGDFDPPRVQAAPGDYIRFEAADGGGHAIVFAGDLLSAAGREFMERTDQLRSPPLIREGASWILTLADAPPGTYPFHCTTHNARGELIIAER